MGSDEPDAQPRDRRLAEGDRLPGQAAQKNRGIPHRTGQRAGMVEGPRQREHALGRYDLVARFQANDAAISGRDADRSACVRTDRPRDDASRHQGGRPAAGPAGGSCRVIGIVGLADVRMGDPVGEFEEVGLEERYGAGLPEPPDQSRIAVRHRGIDGPRRIGGRDARDVDQVLDGDRDAVQRSAIATGLQFSCRRRRGCQRRCPHGVDDGVEARFESVGPCQCGFGDLERRRGSLTGRRHRVPPSRRTRKHPVQPWAETSVGSFARRSSSRAQAISPRRKFARRKNSLGAW